MPSLTPKQARYMKAITHGMEPRNGKGPSISVAKEFVRADEKKHAHKSKEGRADRKRAMNEWAEGK